MDVLQGLQESSLGGRLGSKENGAAEVVTAKVDSFLPSIAEERGCRGWRGCKAACFALTRGAPAGWWQGHSLCAEGTGIEV